MDLAPLQEEFDLLPYDFLVKNLSNAQDELDRNYRDSVEVRLLPHFLNFGGCACIIDTLLQRARTQYVEGRRMQMEEEIARLEKERDAQRAALEQRRQEAEEAGEDFDEEEEIEVVDIRTQVKEAFGNLAEGFEAQPVPDLDLTALENNTVCATLFCIADDFVSHSGSFLGHVFDLFPDRE